MRYAQIREMDITNGLGIGIALYTQGCRFHCKNCFNSELWNFTGGKEWNKEIEDYFLSLAQPDYITRISILGGEPFSQENLEDLTKLVKRIRQELPNIQIWMYTGYLAEVLPRFASDILENIDVLIDGQYMDELRDLKLKFRGSSNQRIIDVKESLKQGKIILYNI